MNVLDYVCPVCGALPGHRCIDDIGQRPRPAPHVARVYIAAEQYLKEDAARGQGSGQRKPSDLAAADGTASPAVPSEIELSPTDMWMEHQAKGYEQ